MSIGVNTGDDRPIFCVQYLRGLAAMLVIFQHTREQLPVYQQFLRFQDGGIGVDVFFIISGFIMAVAAPRGHTTDFLIKRIIRIVPMYWLFTIFLALIVVISPTLLRSTIVTTDVFFKSLLFIPHVSLGHPGKVWPLLVPGWTLTYEMLFYAVFGLLIWLPLARRIAAIGLLFCGLVLLGSLLDLNETYPSASPFVSPLLFEFLAGLVLGYLFLSREPISVSIGCTALAVGVALILVPVAPDSRLLAWGLPALLIVCGSLSVEQHGHLPRLRCWTLLGDASYSIYLSHIFTLGVLRTIWVKTGLVHQSALSAISFAILAMISAVGIGTAIYLLIERPLLRFCRRRYRTFAASRSTVFQT